MESEDTIWKQNFFVGNVGLPALTPIFTSGIFDCQKLLWKEPIMPQLLFVYTGFDVQCFIPEDQIKNLVDGLIEIIKNSPEKIEQIHQETYWFNQAYFLTAKKVISQDLSKLNDKQLGELTKELFSIQEMSHSHSVLTTWFIDSNGETFSEYLIERTKEIIERSNSKLDFADVFSKLTTLPKNSICLEEELESLKVLKKISEDEEARKTLTNIEDLKEIPEGLSEDIKRLINSHYEKWRWLPFDYKGPAYDLDYFLSIWKSLLKENVDVDEEISKIENRPETVDKERILLIEELNLTEEEIRLFDLAANIVFLKGYRKDIFFHGQYALSFILKEAAKRLYLSLNQMYFLNHYELQDALLLGKEIDQNELNLRSKGCTIHSTANGSQFIVGEEAEKFLSKLNIKEEEVNLDVSELKGICACPGQAKGTVRIINSTADMHKMEEGDVMVSHSTFPSLVPAMKKASAIITEDGGITCHAAIVSREMQTPCVTGIKAVTKILKDGDEVEIDANEGIVRISKDKKYKFFNSEPNANILGLDPIFLAFYHPRMEEFFGKKATEFVYELKENVMRAGMITKEIHDLGKLILNRSINESEFEKLIIGDMTQSAEETYGLCKLTLTKLQNLADDERKELIKQIIALYTKHCTTGLAGALVEIGGSFLSDKLDEAFADVEKKNDLLTLLTTSFDENLDHNAEISLVAVANKIKQYAHLKKLFEKENEEIIASLPERIKQDIEFHIFEWGWLNYGYRGPELSLDGAITLIKDALQESPCQYIRKRNFHLENSLRKQKEALVKLSEDQKTLVRIARNFISTKNLRAKTMSFAAYTVNKLLKPLIQKEGYSMTQIEHCTSREICHYFDTGKLPDVNELNQRRKYSLLISREDSEEFLFDDDAKKWIEENIEFEEVDTNISELSGQVACTAESVIRGKAKIINSPEDMDKFCEGDILVSVGTTPDVVPAMKKAAAIITEHGGLTCHASIISRELRIPCIIGTKVATHIFKDGDEVEVDTENGVVRKVSEKYRIIFEENNIVPKTAVAFGNAVTDGIKDYCFGFIDTLITYWKDWSRQLICVDSSGEELAKNLFEKIKDSPQFGLKLVDDIINVSDEVIAHRETMKVDLKEKSNQELISLHNGFLEMVRKQFVPGSLSMFIEAVDQKLSGQMLNYLIEKTGDVAKANEAFSILTYSLKNSEMKNEEIDLLKLSMGLHPDLIVDDLEQTVENLKNKMPDLFSQLIEHKDKYFWVPHDFRGPTWEIKDFVRKMIEVENPTEKLSQIIQRDDQIASSREELIEELSIDQEQQDLFKVLRGFLFTKSYRKGNYTYSCYYYNNICSEIGRRTFLTKEQVWFLLPEEVEEVLSGQEIDVNKINQRMKESVIISKNGKSKYLVGEEAKKYIDKIDFLEADPNTKELQGQVAEPGLVTGHVKIVLEKEDMDKVNKGDILVSIATNPDLLPAMKKSGAIVTEAGGITCHAAIVSRELGIPCVIGTKVATKAFKDGDLVEVDANHGVVRKVE
jgi:phosphoenolpyruvate synthase/pyruvate phosphate dikinase